MKRWSVKHGHFMLFWHGGPQQHFFFFVVCWRTTTSGGWTTYYPRELGFPQDGRDIVYLGGERDLHPGDDERDASLALLLNKCSLFLKWWGRLIASGLRVLLVPKVLAFLRRVLFVDTATRLLLIASVSLFWACIYFTVTTRCDWRLVRHYWRIVTDISILQSKSSKPGFGSHSTTNTYSSATHSYYYL